MPTSIPLTLTGFRVKREIRDQVVFVSHQLFRNPPFAHIDLIVFRNRLSDLLPDVRRAALALFHYALNANGLLLLRLEDAGEFTGFEHVQPAYAGLFRKVAIPDVLPRLGAPLGPFLSENAHLIRRAPSTDHRLTAAYLTAVESYAPPSVLIDSNNQVMHFSKTACQYVHIPGGEPTHDLTHLLQEPLGTSLLQGLDLVRAGSKAWDSPTMYVPTEKGLRRVGLHIERVVSTELLLVVFDDRKPLPPAPEAAEVIATLTEQVRELSARLQKQRPDAPADLIRRSVEEATEELDSVLEELATSKEELQTVNEELVALDIENRRRVQELKQISTDLQHLLASTGVATLFLDRSLDIVRFTPLLGELFALRLSDVGRPISDLQRLERYQSLEEDARCVLEQSQSIDREFLGPDGHWYLSRLLPYRTEAGLVVGVVLTLIDISARKRAELALQASNRNKDEFLAVLAHELRNPLAPISSGVEILKAAPADPAIIEKIAATMGRQTQQLVRLVDDLLEVSRISGGKLQLRTSVIDLREVIRDAVAGAEPSMQRAHHALTVDLPQSPIRVTGDSARLVQVVSNLLNNAVRYTPDGGRIAVGAGCDERTAWLEVSDSGVGVPQDLQEHIFDMFYQGRNSQAGRAAGLGIGLTLAKTLIDLHGGMISVASAGENRGSTFKVQLPLCRDTESIEVETAPAAESIAAPGHRILIVDDNTDAAETLSALLKSLGQAQVYTASSGEQALESAPRVHPDIILLDLMMPELDGYETARRIREQPWGKDLLLVALSGWGHAEHRRKTREVGFDGHLTKPADLQTLRQVLSHTSGFSVQDSGPDH